MAETGVPRAATLPKKVMNKALVYLSSIRVWEDALRHAVCLHGHGAGRRRVARVERIHLDYSGHGRRPDPGHVRQQVDPPQGGHGQSQDRRSSPSRRTDESPGSASHNGCLRGGLLLRGVPTEQPGLDPGADGRGLCHPVFLFQIPHLGLPLLPGMGFGYCPLRGMDWGHPVGWTRSRSCCRSR